MGSDGDRMTMQGNRKGHTMKYVLIVAALAVVAFLSMGASSCDTATTAEDVPVASSDNSTPDNSVNDDYDRMMDLSLEGEQVAQDAASDSQTAVDLVNIGDIDGACALMPGIKRKIDRMHDIVDELNALSAPKADTLYSMVYDMEDAYAMALAYC